MPALYVGNFDFEHKLGPAPLVNLPGHLRRLNHELSATFLAVAKDGDAILGFGQTEIEHIQSVIKLPAPRLVPCASINDIPDPENWTLIPWGWNDEMLQLAQKYRMQGTPSSLDPISYGNARSTSIGWETKRDCGLQGSQELCSIEQAVAYFADQTSTTTRSVIKSQFSMSGRERILIQGNILSDSQIAWLSKRLTKKIRLFVEPWVEKMLELSTHWQLIPSQPPQLLGWTPLLTTERGEHLGNLVGLESYAAKNALLAEIELEVRLLAEHLQQQGYSGPLSVDSMFYRDVQQQVRVRPLQDVNARWSMGRMAWEWGKQLTPGQLGLWMHQSVQPATSVDKRVPKIELLIEQLLRDTGHPSTVQVVKRVSTSPELLHEIPVTHQTSWWEFSVS
jgi:hypothetical protein